MAAIIKVESVGGARRPDGRGSGVFTGGAKVIIRFVQQRSCAGLGAPIDPKAVHRRPLRVKALGAGAEVAVALLSARTAIGSELGLKIDRRADAFLEPIKDGLPRRAVRPRSMLD